MKTKLNVKSLLNTAKEIKNLIDSGNVLENADSLRILIKMDGSFGYIFSINAQYSTNYHVIAASADYTRWNFIQYDIFKLVHKDISLDDIISAMLYVIVATKSISKVNTTAKDIKEYFSNMKTAMKVPLLTRLYSKTIESINCEIYDYKTLLEHKITVKYDKVPGEIERKFLKEHGLRWNPDTKFWYFDYVINQAKNAEILNILINHFDSVTESDLTISQQEQDFNKSYAEALAAEEKFNSLPEDVKKQLNEVIKIRVTALEDIVFPNDYTTYYRVYLFGKCIFDGNYKTEIRVENFAGSVKEDMCGTDECLKLTQYSSFEMQIKKIQYNKHIEEINENFSGKLFVEILSTDQEGLTLNKTSNELSEDKINEALAEAENLRKKALAEAEEKLEQSKIIKIKLTALDDVEFSLHYKNFDPNRTEQVYLFDELLFSAKHKGEVNIYARNFAGNVEESGSFGNPVFTISESTSFEMEITKGAYAKYINNIKEKYDNNLLVEIISNL